MTGRSDRRRGTTLPMTTTAGSPTTDGCDQDDDYYDNHNNHSNHNISSSSNSIHRECGYGNNVSRESYDHSDDNDYDEDSRSYDQDDSPQPVVAGWGSGTPRSRRSTSHSGSSPTAAANAGSGLHHRHVRRTASGDRADDFEQGLLGQNSSNTHHSHNNNANGSSNNNNNNNNLHASAASSRFHSRASSSKYGNVFHKKRKQQQQWRFGQWIRCSLLAGIPAYLLLIYLFLQRLNAQHALQRQINALHGSPQEILYMRDLHAAVRTVQHRSLQQQHHHATDSHDDESQPDEWRSEDRRRRSQPPGSTRSTLEHMLPLPTPTVLSPAAQSRPSTRYREDAAAATTNSHNHPSNNKATKEAKLEELCGFMAQNAALEHPETFLYRDAVVSTPKSKINRVLITGILSSGTAYKLALALQERCHVQVVMGFDNMYPNRIAHRLDLQERMAVLTKYIPKMVRPIFLAYVGLDPLKHSKNFVPLPATGEMDVWKTLTPTHIVHLGADDPALSRVSDGDWKNRMSPYVRVPDVVDASLPHDPEESYDPALYQLRSGLLSMEQILASVAAVPAAQRPHLIYASASRLLGEEDASPPPPHSGDATMHTWARTMDEVLADYYYQEHGVYSVGLRLPNAVYGPGGHEESDLYQIWNKAATARPGSAVVESDVSNLDLLHVDDIVDGILSAMQYRTVDEKPCLFEFSSGRTVSLRQVDEAARSIADPSNARVKKIETVPVGGSAFDENRETLKESLGWEPRIPLEEGFSEAVAWHRDRMNPYGPPRPTNSSEAVVETGDQLLKRLGFATCGPNDVACHGLRPFLPCASECSAKDQCLPTMFDDLVSLTQELTEECDIVLYTQDFDKDANDLELQSEFMEDGSPLVCNFAFVNSDSELVDTVVEKVPDHELSKLGFELSRDDAERPGGMKARKHEKLNGRLLYRGWILIWAKDVPEPIPAREKFFLKIAPGRLFHSDVKSAVFIDQAFGVSPRADDILFLVHEMHRKPWRSRVVKRKTRPKAKFLLPAEPERSAVILMSELKYQDSPDTGRLSTDERISTYEATRFMRYSNGEEPLGKEPADIKLQREFYDRLRTSINPDIARGPAEPLHKFEMNHWVRSRWVAHDMTKEEGRQLRCEWFQEHVLWETDLDQLSFAYVMEKLELDRKLKNKEPDEVVQKHLSEKTEMKKLLSDTFEWSALKTEQNKLYSPYEEMQILPYDMDYTEERELTKLAPDDEPTGQDTALFVRVISDRIMAYARKAWNTAKATSDEVYTGSEL